MIKADAASLKRTLRGIRENGAACAGALEIIYLRWSA
jgi:hypothetical protein